MERKETDLSEHRRFGKRFFGVEKESDQFSLSVVSDLLAYSQLTL